MGLLSNREDVIVMGGGLAGLAAAFALTRAERPVAVFEREPRVGGLARTIVKGSFRFDLGGHRIFTQNVQVEALIRELLGDELLSVPRKSKIHLWGKYFDYPLTPINALFGVGPRRTARVLWDYAVERARRRPGECVSLEDWVVRHFGRTMFEIYFKVYSEKVWGVPAHQVSAEWVARRIQGLSLKTAIRAAFLRFTGRGIPTLADRFLYPAQGVGRLAERLAEAVDAGNRVVTGARVEQLQHNGRRVESALVREGSRTHLVGGAHFVSSIPLTALVRMLRPRPPEEVLRAASRLRYRDLVVVCVMVDRERVTDLSWLYLPDPAIPFARIHEPKNWSPLMAPPGQTHLVAEYFCFEGDDVWRTDDEHLVAFTADHLARLGLMRRDEAIGGAVVRVPRAYPLLAVGYREHYEQVMRYLAGFENLRVIGRGGAFRYLNMDHALEAGMEAAARVLAAADRPAVLAGSA